MILTPHILASGAIGARLHEKKFIVFLILLSLLSHYLLDAMPHLEYDVSGLKNGLNFDFFIAAAKVFLDITGGLLIVYFLLRNSKTLSYAMAGALISLAPDILIFLSWRINNLGLFEQILDFGTKVHYPGNIVTSPIIGVATQIAVVLIVIPIIRRGKSSANNKKTGYLR